MKISDVPRHRIIENLTARNAEKVADTATLLWDKLATQIISIVGEDGLNALYMRSLFLNQRIFPWLPANALPTQTDHPFLDLKMSFEAQLPAQVREANSRLLITLTDILASLIGEQLTVRILSLAWDTEISNETAEEFKSE